MDADFSIELGADDPVLDFPWTDPAGRLAYIDVKRHPEMMARIVEAQGFPELGDFLHAVNSPRSAVESAKCDAWSTTELSAEEDFYNASHKVASYVDLVFSEDGRKQSYEMHKEFSEKWITLLRRAPEIAASTEICMRRCFLAEGSNTAEGFYFTLYVSGYGNDELTARKNWAIGLNLVANAILQLSVSH
ncbi:MAG TPA: hypothetical protein VMI10_06455 [Terriglobales bacterium]|nr:hypothetical protein [Terriglobales bacterium]